MEMRTSAPITNVFEEKQSNFRTARGYLATNGDNDTKITEERLTALEAQVQELQEMVYILIQHKLVWHPTICPYTNNKSQDEGKSELDMSLMFYQRHRGAKHDNFQAR